MCLRARRLSGIIRDRQHADIKYMKHFLFAMLSFINWKEPAEYTMITALAFLDIDSMEYLMAHLKKRGWDDDNFMEKLRDKMKYTTLMLCENNRHEMGDENMSPDRRVDLLHVKCAIENRRVK
jgi:hypothetical protein